MYGSRLSENQCRYITYSVSILVYNFSYFKLNYSFSITSHNYLILTYLLIKYKRYNSLNNKNVT